MPTLSNALLSAAERAFAIDLMNIWPGNLGGDDLQECAIKHGLLTPETRHAPCAESGCACAELCFPDEFDSGITCFRKTTLLTDNEE